MPAGVPEIRRVAASQTTSQTRPSAPVARNAPRQPNRAAMKAVSGGAITAPNADPPLAMPMASALFSNGNHSTAPLVAAGKQLPSPNPRKKRATPKDSGPVAKACAALAADHTAERQRHADAHAQAVHEPATDGEHDRVAELECEHHPRIGGVAHVEFGGKRGSQDGQNLPVQEAERRSGEQQPAQHPAAAKLVGHRLPLLACSASSPALTSVIRFTRTVHGVPSSLTIP